MEKFYVEFKNENDRKTVILTMLAGIIFGFFAFIVTSFCFSNDLSEQSRKIINAFLNFDLILFIISLAINFIPFINLFSILVVPVINLIIILKALKTINENGKEIEIPVIIKIF